jgi:hypothetical protein
MNRPTAMTIVKIPSAAVILCSTMDDPLDERFWENPIRSSGDGARAASAEAIT